MVREHKKGIDRDEKTICIMGARCIIANLAAIM
jgi:hypothetical protein